MKSIIRYLICITLMLPLKGIIPPAIAGSLQELRAKIEKNQISAPEAEKTFKTLTERLSPDDRKSSLVTQVINTARQKNILLSFDETEVVVAPVGGPSTPAKKPSPKEPIKPRPQPQVLEPSSEAKQKPSDVQEKVKPSVAEQKQPAQQELTPQQLDAIKMAIKELGKVYKQESPERITKALDMIKSKIGTAQVPKNVTTALQQLEQFKIRLADDLAFINTLGSELKEIRSSIAITDPKEIKKLIQTTHQLHYDIKEVETVYPNNLTVAETAHAARNTSTRLLYDIIQESMAKAAQLKDRILVRKLVRAYAHVVDTFPLFSEKRLAKEALTKQLADSKTQLLALFEEYTRLDPALVEQRIALLEPVEYLLDDDDLLMLNIIRKYLDVTYDHLATLKDIESTLKEAKKDLRDKPDNLGIIERNLDIIPAALFETTEMSTMQKKLGGTWLTSKITPLATELSTLIAELTQLKQQKVKQSLTNIEKLIEEFEAPPAKPEKPTEELSIVVTPALDLKPISDTRSKKLEEESRQSDIERAQQELAKRERESENQSALFEETKAMLDTAVQEFKKPITRRKYREPEDFRNAVRKNINAITDTHLQDVLWQQYRLVDFEVTSLRFKEVGEKIQ